MSAESSGEPVSLRQVIPAALAGIAVLAVVVGSFVASERFIYYWDFSGYWLATIQLGELLGDPSAALELLVESVRHEKYNLLAAVPLAPLSRVFDYDRTAWVLVVLAVYGLPAVIALAMVSLRMADAARVRWAPLVAVATVVLLPALWAPLLRGSIGIGGVWLAVVVWLVSPFPVREMSIRRAVGIGAMLAGLILFRRWYGFWVLCWVLALGIEAMIARGAWRDRLSGLRKVAVQAASAGVLLLLIATPIALQMLTTDPAASRAAYRALDFYADGLGRASNRFGFVPLAFAAAGLAVAWRSPAHRSLARVMALQTFLILVIFLRAQPFDRHHYYLIAPQIGVLAAVFLVDLARRAGEAVLPRVGLAAGLAVLALGSVLAFGAPVGQGLSDPWGVLATPRYQPQVRYDLPEIVRLSRTLEALADEPKDKIYVLSSYWLLNEDILKNAHLTTEAPNIAAHVELSAHLDRKERFPTRLLTADYAVVTDPPRVHVRAEEQDVILVPAAQILAGTGIGRSFQRLPGEFTLQDGTTVSIYERTGPVRSMAKRRLRERLERDL